jgi:putative transposase
LDLNGRVNLLRAQKGNKDLPIKTIAELLDINRTSAYYDPKGLSDTMIECMHHIDKIHMESPTWGSRQLSYKLKSMGYAIGRRKTRNLMITMGIDAIYPKKNLSKRNQAHKIFPYLLRNKEINRPNQAWSIDVTYIKLNRSFVYLTAIIDWHSRYIVGWDLDDTLGTSMVIRALSKALETSCPEIINSDQGCQFTSKEYVYFVQDNKMKISMDGKGRWADNIMIERWFRTLKYDEIYLKDYANMKEARKQISNFIYKYNFEKLHSALGYKAPADVYFPLLLRVEGF